MFKHLIDVVAGRAREVVIRFGNNGSWKQVTGARVVEDIVDMYNKIDSLNLDKTKTVGICEFNYSSMVKIIASLLHGLNVKFVAKKNSNSFNDLHISIQNITFKPLGMRKIALFPPDYAKCFSSTGGTLYVDDNSFTLDSLSVAASKFVAMPEVIKARSERGEMRVFALVDDTSLYMSIISFFSCLMEGGVFCFQDEQASLDTNLRILRPTVLIFGNGYLSALVEIIDKYVEKRKVNIVRKGIGEILKGVGFGGIPLMKGPCEDLSVVILDSAFIGIEVLAELEIIGLNCERINRRSLFN